MGLGRRRSRIIGRLGGPGTNGKARSLKLHRICGIVRRADGAGLRLLRRSVRAPAGVRTGSSWP
jgi:hypothetical protein